MRDIERKWRAIRLRLQIPDDVLHLVQKRLDDNGPPRDVLLCLYCDTFLLSITTSDVNKHLGRACHIRNAQLLRQPDPHPSQSSYDICSPRQCGFYKELAEFCIVSDIAFEKLEKPETRQFLEKYMRRHIPSEATLRRGYVDVCYRHVINQIRDEIGDNCYWLGIDESTDTRMRKVVNVIIIPLRQDRPGTPRLLNCDVVESANAQEISACVLTSLELLWPNGIDENKFLVLASDGAAYMGVVGRMLKEHFPKLLHITCAAHGLHLIAESVRQLYPECNTIIGDTKAIFVKAPTRVNLLNEMFPDLDQPPTVCVTRWGTWLCAAQYYSNNFDEIKQVIEALPEGCNEKLPNVRATFNLPGIRDEFLAIHQNYNILVEVLEGLQANFLLLSTSMGLLDMVNAFFENEPEIPQAICNRYHAIFTDKPSFQLLRAINECISQNSEAVPEGLDNWNIDNVYSLRYALITTCEVERTFSMYKAVLRWNRQSFRFHNLRKYFIVHCFRE